MSEQAQASATFKVNLRDLFSRVLLKKPMVSHYVVSSATSDQVSGTATLQRFPEFRFGGRLSIPILAHSYAYPLARGGQYAGFTSTAFWFDIEYSGLVAACDYSSNRAGAWTQEPLAELAGGWDWISTVSARDLELPRESVTVDFLSTDPVYVSALQPCVRHQALDGWGIGQGTAYARGSQYSTGYSQMIRLTVRPLGRPGVLAFTWRIERRVAEEPAVTTDITFTVNAVQDQIEAVSMPQALVQVDDNNTHTWVQRQCTWRRMG